MKRGMVSAPLHVKVDKKGDPMHYLCGSCGRRVQPTDKTCVCGMHLLGREITRG